MRPREVRRQSAGLEILWEDSQKTFSDFSSIRKFCTCAVCKEAKVPLNDSMPFFQRSISLQAMNLVGNYAVEIVWADGHRSIVAFDRLRPHEV